MEKDLIPIGETAKLLGVSVDTLRRWDADGTLKPAFVSPGKHRLYRKADIALFTRDLAALAERWAMSPHAIEPSGEFSCRLKPTFQSRLGQLQDDLLLRPEFRETYSLIVSVVGEIGNNSFDHNLGNWPDIQGIFFGYDLNRRKIALADRGRGVLTTLKSVRPNLETHADALRVAFTEVVTGRAPENRGNGLKFVRQIVAQGPMKLLFRSGDAEVSVVQGQEDIKITQTASPIQGCLALIDF